MATSELTPAQRRNRDIRRRLLSGFNFSVMFNLAMNLTMTVIGALKLHECPVQPLIPIILLAEGVVGMVTAMLGLVQDRLRRHMKVRYVFTVLGTIGLVLFIAGSFYTYKAFKPSFDDSIRDQKYCDEILYWFSFFYVSIIYALLGLTMIIMACFVLGIVIFDVCCYRPEETS